MCSKKLWKFFWVILSCNLTFGGSSCAVLNAHKLKDKNKAMHQQKWFRKFLHNLKYLCWLFFECPICSKKYVYNRSLGRHIKFKHKIFNTTKSQKIAIQPQLFEKEKRQKILIKQIQTELLKKKREESIKKINGNHFLFFLFSYFFIHTCIYRFVHTFFPRGFGDKNRWVSIWRNKIWTIYIFAIYRVEKWLVVVFTNTWVIFVVFFFLWLVHIRGNRAI